MRETCFRELYFLCLVVWCISGFYSDVECYPLIDCGHDGDFTQKKRTGERRNPKKPGRPRKTTLVDDGRIIFLEMKKLFTIVGQMKNILREGSAMQSSLCGLVWGDQNKEQIQNVFKRFLFHYSKAQNSVGTVERESHSVHPLMRLSPKFTLRRKKQQVLSRH